MTILDEIVQKKKEALEHTKTEVPEAQLHEIALDRVIYYDFKSAISHANSTNCKIIAEIKHASPSKGVLTEDFDPVAIAQCYQEAGADAISVLTEENYFRGDLGFIEQIREAGVKLPILRKDFIFDSYQIVESAAAGADAVLLIAAIVDKATLADLCTAADWFGLMPVIEVFDEEELRRVLNLKQGAIHIGRPVISASGFAGRDEVERVEKAGADAILVGESLMRLPNPAEVAGKVKELKGL